MCNLYSHTSAHEAIRRLFDVVLDITGNKPPQPGIYPDYMAPIVHNSPAGWTLRMATSGMVRAQTSFRVPESRTSE